MKIYLKYLLIIQILLLSCDKKSISINPEENNIKQLVAFLNVKQNNNLLVKTVDWKNLPGTTTIYLGYGNITSYQYDSKGNLNNFISKSYYNNEVQSILEHQNRTYPTKVYDKEGRLEKEYEYDSNKNVVKIKRYFWPNPKFLEETKYEYKGNTIVKIEQFVTLDGINHIEEYKSYFEDDKILSIQNGQKTIIYLSQDEYQLPIQINDFKVEYSLSNNMVYIKKKNSDGSVSVEEIVFDEKVKPNIPKIQGENKLVPNTIYDISKKNPLRITKWNEKNELGTGKLTKIITSEVSFDYEYNSSNLPVQILNKRKEMYNDLNKRTIISYY